MSSAQTEVKVRPMVICKAFGTLSTLVSFNLFILYLGLNVFQQITHFLMWKLYFNYNP